MTDMRTTMVDLAIARDQVSATASNLSGEQRSLHASVDGLLGTGWTGPAAHQFSGAWNDWNAAAGEILEGLHAMSQLLEGVRVDFAGTDAQTGQDMVRLTARLGPV